MVSAFRQGSRRVSLGVLCAQTTRRHSVLVALAWASICVVGLLSNWEGVSGSSRLKVRDQPSMYRCLMPCLHRNERIALDRRYNITYIQYRSFQWLSDVFAAEKKELP